MQGGKKEKNGNQATAPIMRDGAPLSHKYKLWTLRTTLICIQHMLSRPGNMVQLQDRLVAIKLPRTFELAVVMTTYLHCVSQHCTHSLSGTGERL